MKQDGSDRFLAILRSEPKPAVKNLQMHYDYLKRRIFNCVILIFFIELQGVFGDVSLTSHRLIWSKRSCDHDLNLSLSTVLLVEDEEGSLMSSDKIILTLIDPTTSQQV